MDAEKLSVPLVRSVLSQDEKVLPTGGFARWRDWYFVDGLVGKLPIDSGVLLGHAFSKDNQMMLHRSHLPLLGVTPTQGAQAYRPLEETFTPRETQISARDFIVPRRGTILADEMRLGKTISALTSAQFPIVICAPLMVRKVWRNQVKLVYPRASYVEATGLEAQGSKVADITFCHPDILSAHTSIGKRVGTVIIDEAHLYTDIRNQRGQAIQMAVSNADKIILLTGTPLWNKLAGFYNLLRLLSPAWGAYNEFLLRYCAGTPGTHGMIANGVSRPEELAQRLSEIMLRRTHSPKVDVVRQNFPVALDAEARRDIDMAAFAARKSPSSSYAALLGAYRRALGEAKAEAVIAHVKTLPGRTVVWTWHKRLAQRIASETGGLCVDGTMNEGARAAQIEVWAHPRSAPVPLVLTMAVGQVGIDLSAAEQAVVAELDWTPAVMAQLEMRHFRSGFPLKVHYMVADHEVEESVMAAISKKLDVASQSGVSAAESSFESFVDLLRSDQDSGDLSRLASTLLGRAA